MYYRLLFRRLIIAAPEMGQSRFMSDTGGRARAGLEPIDQVWEETTCV